MTITREQLTELKFYAGEASCHPDPNYWLEFEKLATPGVVEELARIALASIEAVPVACFHGAVGNEDGIVTCQSCGKEWEV